MLDLLHDVAIIGAGLGGCALALSLSESNVPVTVYESRPEVSSSIPSGVMLTPNGLRILDRLGVFARIRERCYVGTHRIFKNDKDETIKSVEVGEPGPNGFRYHRIWRGLLQDEMKAMLKERSVTIHYNSKFNGIVSDSYEGVDFSINDEVCSASLLVGSDGIYSTVRKHIAPGIDPEYTGLLGILSHIKRDSVAWPYRDYDKNATIQGKAAAIFWVSEDPEGEDIMIGKQIHHPKQSREDLARLQLDSDALASFYSKDYDEYGPTAKKIIDSVCASKETLYTWPYLKMPKLPQWYSDTGRVILIGDGAHAIPPSSGQGVNQALEDTYSLTLFLNAVGGLSAQNEEPQEDKAKVLSGALASWQAMRQSRIDAVLEWTNKSSNVARLPEAERKRLFAEGKYKEDQGDDMTWLYQPNIETHVQRWLQSK